MQTRYLFLCLVDVVKESITDVPPDLIKRGDMSCVGIVFDLLLDHLAVKIKTRTEINNVLEATHVAYHRIASFGKEAHEKVHTQRIIPVLGLPPSNTVTAKKILY